MNPKAKFKIKQEVEAWMTPREGMSMKKAVKKLKSLGHQILQIDEKGRKIKVMHVKENK